MRVTRVLDHVSQENWRTPGLCRGVQALLALSSQTLLATATATGHSLRLLTAPDVNQSKSAARSSVWCVADAATPVLCRAVPCLGTASA